MMTPQQVRSEILAALKTIAPELEQGRLSGEQPLRQQIDLDSMDLMNLFAALHERLGVDIPESDYGRLQTLDGLAAYLTRKLGVA